MQEILTLFKKTMKKEGGEKWYSYFAMNSNGDSINVGLTDSAKTEILKSGIQFPLEITLDENDYFITTQSYVNNDGIRLKSYKCVITSFTAIAKADIKKKTITDVFNSSIEDIDDAKQE